MNPEIIQLVSEYTGATPEEVMQLSQEQPEMFENLINEIAQIEQELMEQNAYDEQMIMQLANETGMAPQEVVQMLQENPAILEELMAQEQTNQPQDEPGIGAGSVSNNPAGFDQSASSRLEQLIRLEKTAQGLSEEEIKNGENAMDLASGVSPEELESMNQYIQHKQATTVLINELNKTAQYSTMPAEETKQMTPEEVAIINKLRSKGTSETDGMALGGALGALSGGLAGGKFGYGKGGIGALPLAALGGSTLGGILGAGFGSMVGGASDYAKDNYVPENVPHTLGNASTLGLLGATLGAAGGAYGAGGGLRNVLKGALEGSLTPAGAGVVAGGALGGYQDLKDYKDDRYRYANTQETDIEKQAYYNSDGTYVGDVVQGTTQGAVNGGLGGALVTGGLGAATGGALGSAAGGVGGWLGTLLQGGDKAMRGAGAKMMATKGGLLGLLGGGAIGGLLGGTAGAAAGGALGGAGTAITSGIRRSQGPSQGDLQKAMMEREMMEQEMMNRQMQQKTAAEQKEISEPVEVEKKKETNTVSKMTPNPKKPVKKTHTPEESEKEFYDFLRKVQNN